MARRCLVISALEVFLVRSLPCGQATVAWIEPSAGRRHPMLTLPKHNRYDYSVIGERKDYSWPGGKRLAFCTTTNIEVYAYRKGTGWDPAKKGEPQQQRNYSWRDYGNRVRIWRLFDMFEQFKWPGAAESNGPIDLLKEAGYKYVMDWPAAAQPFWLRTRSGPILSVPYPAELNDSASIIHRENTAQQFADMIVNQFDEMVEQCTAQPLVMTISLHPFVVGQPFRLPSLRKALKHCVEHGRRDRVWWTTPGAVADFCYTLPAGTIPGEGPKRRYGAWRPIGFPGIELDPSITLCDTLCGL